MTNFANFWQIFAYIKVGFSALVVTRGKFPYRVLSVILCFD